MGEEEGKVGVGEEGETEVGEEGEGCRGGN